MVRALFYESFKAGPNIWRHFWNFSETQLSWTVGLRLVLYKMAISHILFIPQKRGSLDACEPSCSDSDDMAIEKVSTMRMYMADWSLNPTATSWICIGQPSMDSSNLCSKVTVETNRHIYRKWFTDMFLIWLNDIHLNPVVYTITQTGILSSSWYSDISCN